MTRHAPRVLAVDPGAKAGYAWTDDDGVVRATHLPELVPTSGWAEAVFEAQHSASTLFRNGRRVRIRRSSQSTLSFTAGRLFERFDAERKFRILPDAWRALLWPGARRLPKPVVLARLEAMGLGAFVPEGTPAKHRADVLEAVGMLYAWTKATPEEKLRYVAV